MNASPWTRVAGTAAGIAAVLTLLVLAFTWPVSDLGPRDLPVAVAGPAPAAVQVEESLATQGENAFDVTTVTSRAEAVELIEDREVYGAIVVGHDGTELLTAPAASPAVANLLTQAAGGAASAGAPASTVTDVVPLPEDDPQGVVFRSGTLPVLIGSILTAAVIGLGMRQRRLLATAVAATAVLGGLALTAVLQGWLGALSGSYLANAAVLALGIAALAGPIAALARLFGPAGVGIGAAVTMLVGNPLSGLTSAPELLPGGGLGQLLAPGALGSALRSTAFFDGAGAAVPLLVLGGWVLLAVVLLVPSARTASDRADAPGAHEDADVAAEATR